MGLDPKIQAIRAELGNGARLPMRTAALNKKIVEKQFKKLLLSGVKSANKQREQDACGATPNKARERGTIFSKQYECESLRSLNSLVTYISCH